MKSCIGSPCARTRPFRRRTGGDHGTWRRWSASTGWPVGSCSISGTNPWASCRPGRGPCRIGCGTGGGRDVGHSGWAHTVSGCGWVHRPDRCVVAWGWSVTPEVSVVVPTHNRTTLLRQTLATVWGQRNVSLEVVVVDDGSTDDTAAVVGAMGDDRVRLIRHETPQGVSSARNHGAAEARGEWVAFCDDDDLWAPDKLQLQLAAVESTGRLWAYAGAVKIDPELRVLGGGPPPSPAELLERLPEWNLMPGGSSNVLVKASAFEASGGFDPALVNLADWDLWNRLALRGAPICVREPLVGYRIHPSNASANTRLILAEAAKLDGRYGVPLHRGDLHHYLAWVSLRSGRRRPAARHFASSVAAGNGKVVAASLATLARGYISRRLPRAVTRPLPSEEELAWQRRASGWLAAMHDGD
ncbi:MAG: glycosyltransferase [Nitriliruptorales bacterium]|nr:glycosyltransferase [Nitriliruptorales bacterium]